MAAFWSGFGQRQPAIRVNSISQVETRIPDGLRSHEPRAFPPHCPVAPAGNEKTMLDTIARRAASMKHYDAPILRLRRAEAFRAACFVGTLPEHTRYRRFHRAVSRFTPPTVLSCPFHGVTPF